MTVELIPVEEIQDNPYQPRETFHKKDIDDIAGSIEKFGMLQTPPARRKDGQIQLAFGGLRKRAYLKLAKKDPQKFGKMPLDIREISDKDMGLYALEENIRRHDISPIEMARAVDNYLTNFPDVTEVDLAEQLDMTRGNVSHMRRVLRLPEPVLEKINLGRINFTMGRELLTFSDLVNGKELMLEAIRKLRSEGTPYGEPCTVEGIQKAIHSVARERLPALEKGVGYYRTEPLFDTRAAGCFDCDKMVKTHPTKSQVAHWCTNQECWDKKQQAHKDEQAAQARAKMREDVLRKVAEVETKRAAGETITQVIVEAEQPSEGILTPGEAQALEEATIAEEAREVKAEEFASEVAKEAAIVHEEVAKGKAIVELPPELKKLVEEKAGTRAEVFDLNTLWLDSWQRQLRQGYELLSHDLERIADPEECLERCTQGFHYAFDSRRTTGEVMYVCTNTKCLSQKKAAFTREKHAASQAKKKAELTAIKHAVDDTTTLDRPRMKLILLAQLEGYHISGYASYEKSAGAWLRHKLGLEPAQGYPSSNKPIMEALDKLTDQEMARLIVEFMLAMLVYTGDIESYKIQTTQPLEWMGIKVTVEQKPKPEKEAKDEART